MRLSAWKSLLLVLISSLFPAVLLPVAAEITTNRPAVSIPLTFERNDGQADRRYTFVSRHGRVQALFTGRGADFVITVEGKPLRRVEMSLVGRSPGGLIEAEQALRGRANYLRGRTAERWVTGVPTYAQLRYREVYPGVDLLFHADESGSQLEHDFLVDAGADAGLIEFSLDGADAITLANNGDLSIAVGARRLMFHQPQAYQG